MANFAIKCLLVENDTKYYELIRDMLASSYDFSIKLNYCETLKGAVEFLTQEEASIVLLDLNLSDSQGIDTFDKIHEKFPTLPVVIISGEPNDSIAIEIVKKGAQDFIYKGDLKQNLLIRTIVYAIERKKLELQKEALQKQLIVSAKMASVGMLVAGIAHEINNPLSIIKGYKDVLLTEYRSKDPELAEGLDKIDIAIERISAIIEGLRVYTGIDVDRIESIEVDAQLEAGLKLIKPLYLKDDVRFEMDFACKDITIDGNKGKFQQVVTNLLSNAKYAIGINKGTISITTREKGESIEIKVSDTGSGIAKENMARIFDTFFSTKPPNAGVGLGLSISASIVKSMGGDIHVDSETGKGATFTLTFPKGTCKNLPKNNLKEVKAYKKFNKTILIVDDEEDIRETMKDHLESFGFKVSMAEDGVLALKMIKKEKYDCLITDLKMPNMRGEELLVEVNKLKTKPTVCAVITGDIVADYEKEKREAIRKYADFYLTKPFSKRKLYEKLCEYFKD